MVGAIDGEGWEMVAEVQLLFCVRLFHSDDAGGDKGTSIFTHSGPPEPKLT